MIACGRRGDGRAAADDRYVPRHLPLLVFDGHVLSRLLAIVIVIAAIDCEMVETTSGGGGSSGAKQSELARLSVVDASGRVLADVLVKPENVVTDYLTQWSGITAQLL